MTNFESAGDLDIALDSDDERAMLHDLGNLVKFQTVSSSSEVDADNKRHRREMERALGYVASEMMRAGSFPLQIQDEHGGYPFLILGTEQTNEPDVVLSAHIDVVTAPREQFKLHRDGERLYGRGVADMKFAIATYMHTFRQIAGVALPRSVALIITSDEEIGGANGARHITEDLAIRPGVVILPDGGANWNLAYRAKGGLYIGVDSHGRNAHASRPASGKNAIVQLMDFYRALGSITDVGDAEDWGRTTTVITGVNGGAASNQVPDNASARFDCRYPSFEERERLLEAFNAAAELSGDGDVDVSLIYETRLFEINPALPEIARFVRLVEHTLGRSIALSSDYGASDARHYQQYAGAPSVVMMPPAGELHGTGEWIERKGILQLQRVLRRYILE